MTMTIGFVTDVGVAATFYIKLLYMGVKFYDSVWLILNVQVRAVPFNYVWERRECIGFSGGGL